MSASTCSDTHGLGAIVLLLLWIVQLSLPYIQVSHTQFNRILLVHSQWKHMQMIYTVSTNRSSELSVTSQEPGRSSWSMQMVPCSNFSLSSITQKGNLYVNLEPGVCKLVKWLRTVNSGNVLAQNHPHPPPLLSASLLGPRTSKVWPSFRADAWSLHMQCWVCFVRLDQLSQWSWSLSVS